MGKLFNNIEKLRGRPNQAWLTTIKSDISGLSDGLAFDHGVLKMDAYSCLQLTVRKVELSWFMLA